MNALLRAPFAIMVLSLITEAEANVMTFLGRSMRRRAVVAFLALVLMACGSDDNATDAGASDDGDIEATSTSLADAGDEASDDDQADEGADSHSDEEADGDKDDDEHADDEHDEHNDEDGSSGGLGAHEHGAAELSVAWTEGDVIVDLVSPTYNIFGFEYEPSTDEERSLVADRTDALTEPNVIRLNAEAGCELVDEVVTELEFEGSHAELTASWLFTCENADEIGQLDVSTLFAEFPNFQDIDAQWVSPSGQSAAELSPSSTVLSFE